MIAFKEVSSIVSGTGTSIDMPRPAGVTTGDLLIVVLGFEGVASGSGPWVVPGDGSDTNIVSVPGGWKRVCYQSPSATGNGLEVWAAIHGSGIHVVFPLTGSLPYSSQTASYTGEYETSMSIFDGAIRAATTAQWTGDDPEAPSVYVYSEEMVVAVGADQLASPGWGAPTPAGWTSRMDAARASSYGNVEITLADKPATVEGNTGTIPFSANSASGSNKGATATLAIRPTAAVVAATSPLIAIEYATAV